MNLDPKIVRQIERGDKTQLRMLVKPARTVKRPGPTPRGGRRPERHGLSATYEAKSFKPELGQSLVVQSRVEDEDEKKRLPEVRVRILDVATQPVGDITLAGAQAEGHETVSEFASDWMRRHDTAWPPQTEALCKQCDGTTQYENHHGETVDCDRCDEVGTIEIDDKDALADTELILARFQRRHAHHLVYVVTFELDTDVLYFLNKRSDLPPTTSPSEALDSDAPLLGEPSPYWADRAEQRRLAALKDRDGARLAGLDRLAVELQAEALKLALEADSDVDTLVRQITDRVDRIKQKVAGRSDQHRRAA